MSQVQPPHPHKVGKTHVKKQSNDNSNSNSQAGQAKTVYCVLCRKTYLKHESQEHMHGMLHHRELETVLGKAGFHDCQACSKSAMGLNEYAEHISTSQHKAKLKILICRGVKPLALVKILDPQTMSQILERNKLLKTKEKKEMKKKKKKLKQVACQKSKDTLQGAARKNTVWSEVVKREKSKQVNARIRQQMQDSRQDGSTSAVFQNKENKVSSLQRPPQQRDSALQNQSGRLACLSGEPAGRSWHHSHVQDHFNQSTHQLRYDNNFSVNKVRTESSQTDRLIRGPHSTQGGATNVTEHTPWPAISQQGHYSKQYGNAEDFTSDHLPQSGAVAFDQGGNESPGSSQPGQEGPLCSPRPASAGKSASAAPIRDVDISSMLRQIRRALGVREPCRADREARKKSGEAGVHVTETAGGDREQPAGGCFGNYADEAALRIASAASASQSSPVSSAAPAASYSGVCASGVAPAKPKQTVEMTQGTAEPNTSMCDSNGPPSSGQRESQGALDSQTSVSGSGMNASSEANLNITRRVRIAHEPGKQTLNKLFSFSGPKSKLSWREMYEEVRRKKQESSKGPPRSGIELQNPAPGQESSPQAADLPLSEGFHWESLPGSPSGTRLSGPPPPPLPPPPPPETQLDSQTREPPEAPEQPSVAQDDHSSRAVEAVSVKVEQNLEDENRDLRDHSSANKRKHKLDDVSDNEPRGKKKKTKSNKDQDQMDRLLAVSLREEELSHSLQDLDRSLIQARNALQAAYAEVQRLLLLRQQCTAEVNSLRAKRIEILQGMQGGYSGTSNVADKVSTSSAGAAAAMQPRLSPLPPSSAFPASSSQQPPPTNPSSSIGGQPHPTSAAWPAVPVKQERCQDAAVSGNPDAPQPVPLFPSLPPLLASPCLAAPTAAAPTARQQERVTWEGRVKTVRSEEVDHDLEEETGGNVAPPRKSPASVDDGGSGSDDSIEMMEPSDKVVIDIDKWDNEDAGSNVPVHQGAPQKSVSVEFSSAGTQTFHQDEPDRKVPNLIKVKGASVPPETAERVEDAEPSVGAFSNHTGPVHGLQVHEGLLYTCSGDNTARAYCLMTRECQAQFTGHTSKVNCLLVASLPNLPARLYTGSSDQTIRCYSTKSKKCLEQITLSDRVLCMHVAWNILFAGLANGSVASYDLKTLKQLDVFECHGPRGVSCLGTAQEGARRVLLVGSYDSTISVRDAKSGLLLRSLQGHTKTVLCMKVVNDLVFSGSSDTSVHAHNIHTGELIRIYKGHGHAVTSIVILGKVMVTACLDKLVRVYELQSHDRLQVYGGHSDMVMCMAIHKSVIYTGCYDGSVQAVKLNLMKNYRCWWQNCSLIFGMAEHLVQHLVRDHTNPNLQTVKCRWKHCSSFFAQQRAVRQELPEHMQSHVQSDSAVQP